MTHVVIQKWVVIGPHVPSPSLDGVYIAIPPFPMRRLIPVPVTGIKIACILKGVEDSRGDNELAHMNAADARMRLVIRAIAQHHFRMGRLRLCSGRWSGRGAGLYFQLHLT